MRAVADPRPALSAETRARLEAEAGALGRLTALTLWREATSSDAAWAAFDCERAAEILGGVISRATAEARKRYRLADADEAVLGRDIERGFRAYLEEIAALVAPAAGGAH